MGFWCVDRKVSSPRFTGPVSPTCMMMWTIVANLERIFNWLLLSEGLGLADMHKLEKAEQMPDIFSLVR
jgi:hypothetical protein